MIVTIGVDRSKLAMGLAGAKKTFMTGISGMASAAKGILSRVFSLKTLMGGLLGGGVTALLARRLISPFAAFEQEMDKSLAIMEGAAGREEELAQKARTTAKELGLAHTETAKSYFYLASAGLDASKSLAAYDTVAKFSVAGTFDMASATDMLTDSLSALGWASEDASQYGENMSRLADMVVKGNTMANTSVEQLAHALMNKGAVAMKLFGQATSDGMATLLAMADSGFAKGTQAGTRLYMLLNGLAAAWRTHGDTLRENGIVIYDEVTGKMKAMADIVDSFTRAFPGGGKPLTDFLAGDIAMNERAVAALGSILDMGDKMRSKFVPGLDAAGGAVDRLANDNLANLMGVWDKFKSVVRDFNISIQKALAPAYEALLKFIGAISEKLNEAIQKGGMDSFIAKVKSLVGWLEKTVKWIKQIKIGEGGEGISKLIKLLKTATSEFGKAMMASLYEAAFKAGKLMGKGFKEVAFGSGRSNQDSTGDAINWMKDQENAGWFGKFVAGIGKDMEEKSPTLRMAAKEAKLEPGDKFIARMNRAGKNVEEQIADLFGGRDTKAAARTAIEKLFEDIRSWSRNLHPLSPAGQRKAAEQGVHDKIAAEKAAAKADAWAGIRGAVKSLVPDVERQEKRDLEWELGDLETERGGLEAEQGDLEAEQKRLEEEGQRAAPSWQRSGIESMADTLQDAIMGKHQDKLDKDRNSKLDLNNKKMDITNTKLDEVTAAIEKISLIDTNS